MGGNDRSAVQSRRSERHIRAIEEGATGSCFRMSGLLIRRLGQTSLNQRLAGNASALSPSSVQIRLFGIPPAFARLLGMVGL